MTNGTSQNGTSITPWKDDVSVEEWEMHDFQKRTDPLTVYDSSGLTFDLLAALSHEYGLSDAEVADRAVRTYLAFLMDSGQVPNLRDKFETRVLIPPPSWMFQQDRPEVTPRDTDRGKAFGFGTAPTVHDMVYHIVEHGYSGYSAVSSLIIDAVTWFARYKEV